MLHMVAKTADEKRTLAKELAKVRPDVLNDLKMIADVFGQLQTVALAIENNGNSD